MPRAKNGTAVNIRPGVRILTVLRHLNYKPWFALAEFVDNAVQSYLINRRQLGHSGGPPLTVAIEIDNSAGGRIVVRDNAAGIHRRDFARAFRAAELPPDGTGLSEFGMGMKSAACWFAPRWSVRTKAVGQPFEDTVSLDIEEIVKDSIEELDVASRPADRKKHYTEITLTKVYGGAPQGRTIGKIRAHLTDIYRVFLRKRLLKLTLNGESLTFSQPTVLRAPYFKEPKAKPRLWKVDIDLKLPGNRRVEGFAAIRERASVAEAGFALIRRDRLIQGSADEGWRPEEIFGQSNSYAYQRLFGELHLTGFDVSHTKDGIRWGNLEEEVLRRIKQALTSAKMPLLQQVQGFRAKPPKEDLAKQAEEALGDTVDAITKGGSAAFGRLHRADPVVTIAHGLGRASQLAAREFSLRAGGLQWTVAIDLVNDPSIGAWLDVAEKVTRSGKGTAVVNNLQMRLNLDHPFMTAFMGSRRESLEALVRVAVAIGLGEVSARYGGVKQAGTVRRNVNELLRDSLAITPDAKV